MASRYLRCAETGWARRLVARVRAWQIWGLQEPLRGFLIALIVLAAAAIPLAAAHTHWRASQLLIFVALVACGVATIESTRAIKEIHGALVRDLQPVWYLVIAVMLPPVYAFAAPAPLVIYKLWRQPGLVAYRRVFSNATISIAYGCTAWLFHLTGRSVAGPVPGSGVHVLTWTGIVTGCGILAWTINAGLVVTAIKLADRGAGVRELLGRWEGVTSDLIELSMAVSLSVVVALNPVLISLALPSVLLYRRYLMQAQLVAQARMDAKTGLLNAETWRREAEVEFIQAMRARTPLALIMVDVDHFSSVSETAGLEAGDQVLRGMARTLTEKLRGAGIVGRFGNEEFAILLPRAGEEEARRVAERLRDQIAGEPVAIEDSSHAGFVFRLTVSIGIAILDHSRQALAELIGAADVALSEAKSSGRNRVCLLPGTVERSGATPSGG